MSVRLLFCTLLAGLAGWSGANLHAQELLPPTIEADGPLLKPISFDKVDHPASTTYEQHSMLAYPTCRSGWRMGVEATFLAPMGGNQQSWSLVDIPNGTTESFSTDAHGIEGLVPAPRLWMGYVCDNGWGLQFRYWELNTSSNYTNAFLPYSAPSVLSGDTFGFASAGNLEMYALDLEVVKEFCLWDWNMVGTFGYRHALRDYNETISVQGLVERPAGLGGNVDFFNGNTSGVSVFEGDGLTGSLSGYQRTCNCFQWFWSARGSVLFGDSYAAALTNAQMVGPGAISAVQTNGGIAGDTDTMWITEFQVGCQWSTQLSCIPGRFFARGAFEYQHWGQVGGAAGATSTVGELNVGSLTVNAGSPNDSLDLVGFAFATGIVW